MDTTQAKIGRSMKNRANMASSSTSWGAGRELSAREAGLRRGGPCAGIGMGTSVGLTVAPCCTRCRPLTMTRSPGFRPSVMTWRPSWSEPSFTAWRTTLLSSSTT